MRLSGRRRIGGNLRIRLCKTVSQPVLSARDGRFSTPRLLVCPHEESPLFRAIQPIGWTPLKRTEPSFLRPLQRTHLLVMTDTHDFTLTVSDIAAHFSLSHRTIRDHLSSGRLKGVRIGGLWRARWRDVWSAETGPAPRGQKMDAYRQPLLTKAQLAARWAVSERTVERWIAAGLPTRNVFTNVRVAPVDAEAWILDGAPSQPPRVRHENGRRSRENPAQERL